MTSLKKKQVIAPVTTNVNKKEYRAKMVKTNNHPIKLDDRKASYFRHAKKRNKATLTLIETQKELIEKVENAMVFAFMEENQKKVAAKFYAENKKGKTNHQLLETILQTAVLTDEKLQKWDLHLGNEIAEMNLHQFFNYIISKAFEDEQFMKRAEEIVDSEDSQQLVNYAMMNYKFTNVDFVLFKIENFMELTQKDRNLLYVYHQYLTHKQNFLKTKVKHYHKKYDDHLKSEDYQKNKKERERNKTLYKMKQALSSLDEETKELKALLKLRKRQLEETRQKYRALRYGN